VVFIEQAMAFSHPVEFRKPAKPRGGVGGDAFYQPAAFGYLALNEKSPILADRALKIRRARRPALLVFELVGFHLGAG
jgi:hypothetical protein